MAVTRDTVLILGGDHSTGLHVVVGYNTQIIFGDFRNFQSTCIRVSNKREADAAALLLLIRKKK